MPVISTARNYADFLKSIPHYVRLAKTMSVEDAKAQIRARLQNREQMFLEMIQKCIFGYPRSPYHPLLRAAGCELGDIRQLVANDGIDKTLTHLRREGIFFTFEEFKGRTPVERSGLGFEINTEQFQNPKAKRHISTRTGGSTGAPVRSWMSMEQREFRVPTCVAVFEAHGLIGVRASIFDNADLSSVIQTMGLAVWGPIVEKHFVPRGRRSGIEALRFGAVRRSIAATVRSARGSFPKFEFVDPQDLLPIAKWVEMTLHKHGRSLIWAGVSAAVRIARVAAENGIQLDGAVFMGNDEPATPSKVREITRGGAKWIPVYGSHETGYCGDGCVNPVDGSDVHLMSDRVAVIQHPRMVPGSNLKVDAFNFTSLWAHAPLVLLNVELDDFGVIEQRHCGCALEEVGYGTHLREIYSFQKLTGEGVTLVGSDMVRILEEVLPSRFGGSSLDYQLMEEEDEQSLTRLSLLIHPRLEIADEALVIKTIFDELKSGDGATSMAGTIWAQSGTFRIRRIEPIGTSAGKLLPLHVSRRSPTR